MRTNESSNVRARVLWLFRTLSIVQIGDCGNETEVRVENETEIAACRKGAGAELGRVLGSGILPSCDGSVQRTRFGKILVLNFERVVETSLEQLGTIFESSETQRSRVCSFQNAHRSYPNRRDWTLDRSVSKTRHATHRCWGHAGRLAERATRERARSRRGRRRRQRRRVETARALATARTGSQQPRPRRDARGEVSFDKRTKGTRPLEGEVPAAESRLSATR